MLAFLTNIISYDGFYLKTRSAGDAYIKRKNEWF